MALSMEERRILAEIESHLAENDPKLAARLAAGPREKRRLRRIQIIIVAAAAVAEAGMLTAIVAAIITAIS